MKVEKEKAELFDLRKKATAMKLIIKPLFYFLLVGKEGLL